MNDENKNQRKHDLNAEVSLMTDEELVALALTNQEYFLCVIDRYKDKLFRYIRRIINVDEEEVEDILQEIFIKVYLNLNDFDQDLKFSSWVYRVAHNHTISYYRKIKVRPQGNSVDIGDEEFERFVSDLNPVDDVDRELLRKGVEKVLAGMESKYREILVLKFIEEKSYKEISDILERPMGTVASMMNKAKQEFRGEVDNQKIVI